MTEPKYRARVVRSILDPYREQLMTRRATDSRRAVRDRRAGTVLFQQLQAAGYPGGYGRRRWRSEGAPRNTAKPSCHCALPRRG